MLDVNYSKSDKVRYYESRVNNNKLSKGQREFAQSRLDSLLNTNRYSSSNKKQYKPYEIKKYYKEKYDKQYDVNMKNLGEYLYKNDVAPTELIYTKNKGFYTLTRDAFKFLKKLVNLKQTKTDFYKENYYYYRSTGLGHKDSQRMASDLTKIDLSVRESEFI